MKSSFARRAMAVLLSLTMIASLIPAVLAVYTLDGYTIAITSSNLEVEEGKTLTLSARVTYNDGSGDTDVSSPAITWSSDSPTTASVNQSTGEVTGVAAGTAIIHASYALPSPSTGTVETTCQVTVKAASVSTPPVLTLNANTLELGSTPQTLTAEVNGTGVTGTGRYTWAPQNNSAIRMSGSGRSITLTAGAVSSDTPVTVTVTYTEGSVTLTGECVVTVKANTSSGNIMTSITGTELPGKPAEGEAVNMTLKSGAKDTLTFELTMNLENGATSKITSGDGNATYTWSSDNQRLLTVQPNRGTNTATVTASSNDTGSGVIRVHATYTWNGRTESADGSFTIKVERRVGTIRLSPTGPFTMEPNGQQTIRATTEPAGEAITWTVPAEDTSIATVQANSSGGEAVIYAHSPGKTSITATIGEGANTESQSAVVEVSGMILEYTSLSLMENEQKMIPVVQRFGNAQSVSRISWQTMDPNVAEVSGSSVVGRGKGRTTITGFAGAYSASFTVEVGAGSNTIDLTTGTPLRSGDKLEFSTLSSQLYNQVSGGLSHLTSLSVPTNQGTLYYNYVSDAQHGEGVAQSENYYYQGGSGRKVLSKVTFVPKPGYSGPVTISYNAVAQSGEIVSCRILHQVEGESSPAFTLNTDYNTPLRFSGTEFNQVCVQQLSAQLEYVSFSLPPVRQGSLYTDYVDSGNYGSAVTIRDTFSRKDLDDVWFVPAPGFPASSYAQTVTVYYTAHGRGGGSFSGQIRITVEPENNVSIGGLAYDVVKGGVARFDDLDFSDYCRDVLDGNQTLSFVRFDALPSADQGVLYYDYRSAANTGSRAAVGTTYYYGTRTPRIDRLSFVAAEDFTGTIKIPFTGQTTDGTRFTGNVEINVRGSSAGSGNIYYKCQPGKSVSFDDSDFNRLCREQINDRLNYIEFQGLPNSGDGTLYYSGSAAAVNRAYYNGSSYPRIDNLSFRANSRFSGSVDIPFIGTASSGETFYGIVTIDSNSSGSSGNDLHYYTDTKSAAVFDRDDFDDLSRWLTDRDISSVRFTIPSTSQGDLYQNYRSSSSKGSRITSNNTTIYASSLDRVAFLPASGFTGTVYIDFTARAANNEEFSGSVEVTVERAAADVTVRYSTQVSPVDFRGSDFAKSGSTLRSIKFGTMPATSAGHLYYQYSSPTRYDRQASTGSTYNLSGSNLISSLTFVPKAGFSGTVTLPYTGTNSGGSTFDGEVIITVSPSYSSAYFNDMGSYTDEQRGAVDYLHENGVTTGVGGGRYGPTSSITRGDFALMVYKAFGLSPTGSNSQFSDVPSSAYYAQAVNTLYALGIVSGVGSGRYGPNNQVTREDALIMVRQAMRSVGWSASDGYNSVLNSYSDGSTVSEYAKGAVSFALQMGYLPTAGGRVAPREQLSRVDMAVILHRVLTS